MKLHTLKPAAGSTKNRKRIGRGEGSTFGDTAGRGHKGAQSRSGYSKKKGFEGGQMPLQRRIPKRGFKNINRIDHVGLNLDTIQELATKYKMSEITLEGLKEHGIVGKTELVKILGRGEINKALKFKVNAYTQKAKEAIESAGGTAELI